MSNGCAKCGAYFEVGDKFCKICGSDLDANQKKICPSCNSVYTTRDKFCAKDGTVLILQQDIIYQCSICSSTYSSEVRFCPKDGGFVKVGNQVQQNLNDFTGHKKNQVLYPKASSGKRFVATILDLLISVTFSIPSIYYLFKGLQVDGELYQHVDPVKYYWLAAFLYLIPLTYQYIKDGFGEGQSLGKVAVDLMVVDLSDNSPCSFGTSFYRNFVSALVALIPIVGPFIEPIIVLSSDDGRKWGDQAAKTQVIDIRDYTKK
jgi:uncharacterized RDD family membrane protein YckC